MRKEYGIREHMIRFFKSILWSVLIFYALYLVYNYINLLQYNINIGTLRNATHTNNIWIVILWLLSGFTYAVAVVDSDIGANINHNITFNIFNSVCVIFLYYCLTATPSYHEYYNYLKILPVLISWLISEVVYISVKIFALLNDDIYESDFIDCIKYRVISLSVLLGLILLLFL